MTLLKMKYMMLEAGVTDETTLLITNLSTNADKTREPFSSFLMKLLNC